MKKYFFLILIFFLMPLTWPAAVKAASLGKTLAGRILLNVEKNGEAWYVNPVNNNRYYLGRPADAFRIMRELAIGINNSSLARIETSERDKKIGPALAAIAGLKEVASTTEDVILRIASSTPAYDKETTKRLSGSILLQVEGNGEAWYLNPKDNKKYYLGRPTDAFRIMRELSLGITREDLAKIHKAGINESLNQYSQYEHKKVTTAANKSFTIDLITVDLSNPKLKIVTDTAADSNCKGNCPAKSLAKYALAASAFAGINGSYFCDSSSCGYNYTFYPVYNTRLGIMINEDQLKYWTTGPIFAFDQNNKFYYFKDSREFGSVANFEKTYGVKLQAAIGNKPRLVQDYMDYLIEWELDKKQLTNRSVHNALGYKDNKIYITAVYSATIPEVAQVMQALGMEYALNLDGGGSTALWYNDEYILGPGRDIPNAIVFREE